ncbi:MAG: arylesterase [Desulfobacterales bacterium]|nr:MAG: arylesterase [Desulfobacterales bacterium]
MALFPAGCQQDAGPEIEDHRPLDDGTIVAIGDSLTEGYEVAPEEAYPAELERKLRRQGYSYRVINAGISGETSSGVLSRIQWTLKLKPDIVILVTGANDGLRGIDPQLTATNIDAIVRQLKARNITVIVGGMQMVRNLGKDYTGAFARIYPAVAQKRGVILIPFFLAGVAGNPQLNQADGIHPTAEGYRVIVANIFPYVVEALKEHQAKIKKN